MSEWRRTARAAILLIGPAIGALVVLGLALHFNRHATNEFLEPVLASIVIVGAPLALAMAAIQRRYAALTAVLCLGILVAVLVTMASLQFPQLRASMREVPWVWIGFYVLAGASLLIAIGVAAARKDYSMLATLVVLSSIGAGLMILAEWVFPDFISSMQEDAWAEWATAYAFLGASLTALLSLWLWKRKPNAQEIAGTVLPVVLCGAALFCFAVAGEELSWGQRLFNYRPPELFTELNYQQELNIHNFFKEREVWEIPLDSRYLVVYVSIGLGMAMPLAAWLVAHKSGRSSAPSGSLSPPLYLAPWFAAVAWAEVSYPGRFTGEAAELLMGLVLLADAVQRFGVIRRGSDAVGPALYVLPAVLAVPFVMGTLTPMAVQALSNNSYTEAVLLTREELELLKSDLSDPKTVHVLATKYSVHRRLFTAARFQQLEFGNRSRFLEFRTSPAEPGGAEPRRDRRGYFLDPWNNSYWIQYSRRRDAAIIYSFGPNRRRDTNFERLSEEEVRSEVLDGDDIGVTVTIPAAP